MDLVAEAHVSAGAAIEDLPRLFKKLGYLEPSASSATPNIEGYTFVPRPSAASLRQRTLTAKPAPRPNILQLLGAVPSTE